MNRPTPTQLNHDWQKERNDSRLVLLSNAITDSRIEQKILDSHFSPNLELTYNNGLEIEAICGNSIHLIVRYHDQWTLDNDIKPMIVNMLKDKGFSHSLRVSVRKDGDIDLIAEVLSDLANW